MAEIDESDNIREAIGREVIKYWWNTPVDFFNGKTPAQVFDENPTRVIKYVRGLSETVVNINFRD